MQASAPKGGADTGTNFGATRPTLARDDALHRSYDGTVLVPSRRTVIEFSFLASAPPSGGLK